MLFYLDPPYWAYETDYDQNVFRRNDVARLADQLGAIAGKVMLSINNTPDARVVFNSFELATAETPCTVGAGAGAGAMQRAK